MLSSTTRSLSDSRQHLIGNNRQESAEQEKDKEKEEEEVEDTLGLALLPCLHFLCLKCLNSSLCNNDNNNSTCPVCNDGFSLDNVFIKRCASSTYSSFSLTEHLTDSDHELLCFLDEPLCENCLQATLGQEGQVPLKHFLKLDAFVEELEQQLMHLKNKVDSNFGHLMQQLEPQNKQAMMLLMETAPPRAEEITNKMTERTKHAKEQWRRYLVEKATKLKEQATQEIQADVKKASEAQQTALLVAKQYTTALQQQIQVLKQQVEISKQQMNELQHQIEECTKKANDVTSAIQLCDLLIRRASDLKQNLNLQSQMVRFMLNVPAELTPNPVTRTSSVTDLRSIQLPRFTIHVRGSQQEKRLPCGLARMSNGNLMVSDNSKRILIFSPQASQENCLNLQESIDQFSISPKGEIWGVSICLNLLSCLSSDGTTIRQFNVQYPFGTVVLPNGFVAVSLDGNRVVAFSEEGEMKWSTGCIFNVARGLLAVNKDELFVCDCRNHQIQVLSVHDGRFLRLLGKGYLDRPNDAALIPNTDMVVVLQNARVSILTLEGKHIHTWGSAGTNYGQFETGTFGSIEVLFDGQIAVADYENHRVQVF